MIALKTLLEGPDVLVVPGAFDALGALAVQQAGFPAVSLTGNGLAAALLGRPDLGLLTMTEVAAQVKHIADAVSIPLIADADTGYGGPLNVYRTVKEFGAAGASAVHIEDQTIPKRCAFLGDPPAVVSLAEGCQRVRMAREAADEIGLVLIARTDAHRAHGLDEVMRRAEAYARAGADALFTATIGSLEEVRRLAAGTPVPLMVNMNTSAAIAEATVEELRQAGARLAIYPSVLRQAALRSMQEVLALLRADGHLGQVRERLASGEAYDTILDTAGWVRLERKFDAPPEA